MKVLKIVIFVILSGTLIVAVAFSKSLDLIVFYSPAVLGGDIIITFIAMFALWATRGDALYPFKVINRTVQKFLEGLKNVL